MKITDIKKSDLPIKVKLNDKFTLDESFDPNMIVEIRAYGVEDEHIYDKEGRCHWVDAYLLPVDEKHNRSVAKRNWGDGNGNYNLNFFETTFSIEPNKDGEYYDKVFVMENDDCFDVIEPKLEKTTFGLLEVGDRFTLSNDPDTEYRNMKVEPSLLVNNSDHAFNVINLSNGKVRTFTDNEYIFKFI